MKNLIMTSLFIANISITPKEAVEEMRSYASKMGFEAVFRTDFNNDYKKTIDAVNKADIFVADLTPFLSVEPDSDTIFLLGFAAAKEKPVFNYMNVDDPFYARHKTWNKTDFIKNGFLEFDKFGNRIENMGKDQDKRNMVIYDKNNIAFSDPDNQNNLMLEGPSTMTGSFVLTPDIIGVEEKIEKDNIYTNIKLFKATIDIIRQRVKLGQLGVHKFVKNSKSIKNSFYIAGPDVFFTDLNKNFANKKQIMKKAGFTGIPPTENQLDFEKMQSWKRENGNNPQMRKQIYMTDIQTMHNTSGGIFNFTPFQGVFADSGTTFEFGYTIGLDKLFAVYTNDPRNINERIEHWGNELGGKQAIDLQVYRKNIRYSNLIDNAILQNEASLENVIEEKNFLNLYYSENKQAYFINTQAFEKAVNELSRKKI